MRRCGQNADRRLEMFYLADNLAPVQAETYPNSTETTPEQVLKPETNPNKPKQVMCLKLIN